MALTFAARVYRTVEKIPRGKVATYGQVARLARAPGAARAVGRLMAANSNPRRIPCHRVVASDGALTGYAFGGIVIKRRRLSREGVAFKGAYVDLARSRWRH